MSNQHTHEENTQPTSDRQLLLQDIGLLLMQAREQKRENISKPVRKLKIPINHLEALENGNWDELPDDVYVIGFLRQYSAYLNIDLSSEINRLKNSEYTLTRPLTFPDPPVAPSRRWAWLSGGAFILLFIIFNVVSNNDETEDNTPTQASAPAHTAEPNSIESTKHVIQTKVERETTVQRAEKPSPTLVASAMPDPAPALNKPIISTKPSIRNNVVSTSPSGQTDKPHLHTYRFDAVTAPVWLQVFSHNSASNSKGRLIKEMLLKKGQHATVRRRTESLWITCGNALALRIRVDNKTIINTGKLGSGKKVLRDYRFNYHH